MLLHSRRFSIWLLSFLAVLVIYFIYNRMSRTPLITASSSVQPSESVIDVCDVSGRVGMVGDVGVGAVRNVRYTKLNSQKQVEREFGFEELLHQDGNDWEIEKPYYTIYSRSFKSTISGNRANVTVEAAGGQVTPRKGVLTGNVTIRIWPRRKGSFSDAVIYLDDVVFAGEKSLFSSRGLVELVSDDLQLTGTGLEVVYNSDEERLERLKIKKLQRLRIKRWSRKTVFGSESTAQKGTGGPEHKAEKSEGHKYRCIFDQNVIVETAQERLLAQVVSISHFLISSGSADEPGGEDVLGREQGGESKRTVTSAVGTSWNAGEAAGDVEISCNGGILIVPMDSAEWQKQISESAATNTAQLNCPKRDGKTMFCGSEVDYSVATGEAIASGPSRIIFDVNDRSRETASGPATVTITSQKQASFEPESSKCVFEGDCRCTISQVQPDMVREYIVTGDVLEVDLGPTGGEEVSTSSLDVKRLIATGGVVRLASTKKAGERLLAGIELKCARMDYNAVSEDFVATGPGLIKVDNSQTDEPQKGFGRFSLRRKCFAFLRQFDLLKYFGRTSCLVADSEEGSLLIDYFPIVGGSSEDKVAVTASHVEAWMAKTAQQRMELVRLVAKGAVTYEDKENEVQGSEFVYDADSALINVSGDSSMPGRFNGAIIDTAEYNVKTGRWKTKIKGPGTLR